MTREEAQAILQVWRPGGQDAADPRFREALTEVERDPELARWFAVQKAFDATMAEGVQRIPVPRSLKSSILAEAPRRKAPFWQIDLVPWLQSAGVRWAMASCFVALLAVGGWRLMQVPQFADYRREVVEAAWESNPHVDFRTTNLAQVKQWLSERGVPWSFSVPSDLLQSAKIIGCSVAHWRGHDVVRLCLIEGSRHQHLFVADEIEFQDPPPGHLPDYENFGRWTSTAWSHGDRTYVLAGMKYSEFTKRFYRGGQWRLPL
jgi:hypothetical protein